MPVGVGCVTAPERIRVSKAVMEKLLLSRIEPVYPPETQTEHIDGVVVVRVTIDEGGSVSRAESMSGPPALIPRTIEAVKQWKYRPFLLNGEPVEVETTVEISFPR